MRTNLVMIIDRTGSMAPQAEEASSAVNLFITEQQKLVGKCRFTMVEFDSQSIDVLHDNVKLTSVVANYKMDPRASTPLLDAIGQTIVRADQQAQQRALDQKRPFDKVIFVIMTDGLENASTEYTLDQIQTMVKQRTEQGWDFVYLGAGPDAFHRQQQYAQAAASGAPQQSTITHDSANYTGAAIATASAVSRSRMTGDSVEYTDAERKQAEGDPT